MKKLKVDIDQEFGPFPGANAVHGVTFDGHQIWFASGDRLHAVDPDSGTVVRSFEAASHAGTAFDGKYLYQIAEKSIQKIDPQTGAVLKVIPAPGEGGDSGLAWAEGVLWVGQYREGKIHQVDPETGRILRTLETNQLVTGVTWVDGELWHGALNSEQGHLRRLDPLSGKVLEQVDLPAGIGVTGLESDGGDRFFCGGGKSGKIRVVHRKRK